MARRSCAAGGGTAGGRPRFRGGAEEAGGREDGPARGPDPRRGREEEQKEDEEEEAPESFLLLILLAGAVLGQGCALLCGATTGVWSRQRRKLSSFHWCSSWSRSWCANATDHGGFRGSDAASARRGADRGIVPLILEEIVKVITWVQFVDKVVDAPVGVHVVMPKTVECPQLKFIVGPRQFLDKDVDVPVAVHVELKTVEHPQLQFIVGLGPFLDRVVDVHVAVHVGILKLWSIRSCSLSIWWSRSVVQVIDKVWTSL